MSVLGVLIGCMCLLDGISGLCDLMQKTGQAWKIYSLFAWYIFMITIGGFCIFRGVVA